MNDHAFVVVPFQRVGNYIGPQQMMICQDIQSAKVLANKLCGKVSGVALIERSVDEDTGADVDTVIAKYGVVPENMMHDTNWKVALH